MQDRQDPEYSKQQHQDIGHKRVATNLKANPLDNFGWRSYRALADGWHTINNDSRYVGHLMRTENQLQPALPIYPWGIYVIWLGRDQEIFLRNEQNQQMIITFWGNHKPDFHYFIGQSDYVPPEPEPEIPDIIWQYERVWGPI